MLFLIYLPFLHPFYPPLLFPVLQGIAGLVLSLYTVQPLHWQTPSQVPLSPDITISFFIWLLVLKNPTFMALVHYPSDMLVMSVGHRLQFPVSPLELSGFHLGWEILRHTTTLSVVCNLSVVQTQHMNFSSAAADRPASGRTVNSSTTVLTLSVNT